MHVFINDYFEETNKKIKSCSTEDFLEILRKIGLTNCKTKKKDLKCYTSEQGYDKYLKQDNVYLMNTVEKITMTSILICLYQGVNIK